MKQELLVKNIQCVQTNGQGKVCGGSLTLHEDKNVLKCQRCGNQYQSIGDVPILKPETDDSWYEQVDAEYKKIYSDRSRSLDIESNYLAYEREFMGQFVREHKIQGPCLEIGCGTGLFAEIVPNFIGLDYYLELLLAEGFESFNRLCADGRYIPLADASVECVYSFNALEHIPDVELAFSEMDRVLKPGGFLVLKPAWHCAWYNNELILVLPYQQLNARQKIVKGLLPILQSKLYKGLTRIPWRILRRMTSSKNNSLSWEKLTPYQGELWRGGDVDAVASIDCHEGILYYQSRGYQCLSHPSLFKQILAGHDLAVLRKP